MTNTSSRAAALLLAGTCLLSSGCMAIVEAPRFFGGTRGWINFLAADKHFVHRRTPAPYALVSRAIGFGDLRPILWPFMVVDFVPSLAIDLVLLPISIPHLVGEELDETRLRREEERRRELREEEDRRQQRAWRDHARERTRRQKQSAARRRARQSNDVQAQARLRDLAAAQRAYKRAHPEGLYAASLEELAQTGGTWPATAQGYQFSLQRSASAPDKDWIAVAAPIRRLVTGTYTYAVDTRSVVRRYAYGLGVPADCRLPPHRPSPPTKRLESDASSQSWVARHNRARAALTEIARAQADFKRSNPAGLYADRLEPLLARGTRRYQLPDSHTFELKRSERAPSEHWIVTASPRHHRVGTRWFAVDSAGRVRTYSEPFGEIPPECTLESLEAQRGW